MDVMLSAGTADNSNRLSSASERTTRQACAIAECPSLRGRRQPTGRRASTSLQRIVNPPEGSETRRVLRHSAASVTCANERQPEPPHQNWCNAKAALCLDDRLRYRARRRRPSAIRPANPSPARLAGSGTTLATMFAKLTSPKSPDALGENWP